MEEKNMKEKTITNLIWRFAERILAQGVTLLVTIVLARILLPEDYGAVSLISVFVNICNVFVTKSFGNALIQKKDADDVDFSTVFYINMAMTVLVYSIIFISAPWIAEFYNMPELSPLLRVMGLRIPCAAINSVQNAYVARQLKFKKFFFATLTGTVVSAGVGIGMAFAGMGAWALVFQYLSNVIIDTIFLWFTVKWRPKLLFSFKRARFLFSYGGKLLASSLLEEANIEIKSSAIGKVYSSVDLAFYTKGKQFPTLINTNINESISSVLFPVLAQSQGDVNRLRDYMKRVIKTAAFVIFPLQFGLMAVATQFVSVFLTDKWLGCVPYLRIMCLAYLCTPINTANMQAIKAMGKSGYVLKISVISNIAGIVIMFLTLPFGVTYVAWGAFLSTVLTTVISSTVIGRLIHYGTFRQIKDLLSVIVLSVTMAGLVYIVGFVPLSDWILLIIQILVGGLYYIIMANLFKVDSYQYIKDFVIGKIKKKENI